MAKLTFGMSFHETYRYDRDSIIRYAKMVEDLGFDTLWITENVNIGADALEPLLTLGLMAAHTQSITFGPSVILMPLRNVIGLAHAAATLDRLSGGRLILGVGTGGNVPIAFQAYGASLRHRGRFCDEALEVMTGLWSGRPVDFSGQLLHLENYTLGARPLQQPHPPLWIGGTADGVLRRTARWGDGFIPHSISLKMYKGLLEKLDVYCQQAKRDTDGITKALQFYFCMAGSREEAQETAEKALVHRYNRVVSLADSPDTCYALGTPDDIAETIQGFVDIGVTHFAFSNARPPGQVTEQIERLAREVLPRFK